MDTESPSDIKKALLRIKDLNKKVEEYLEIYDGAKDEIMSRIKGESFFKKIPLSEREKGEGIPISEENEEIDFDSEIDYSKSFKTDHSGGFKKLYREIVKKIHPDKLTNKESDDEREEFKNLYNKTQLAYEKKRYIDLLEVGEALDIDYEFLSKNETRVLEDRIVYLENKIREIMSSIYWTWAHCDHKQREEIIKKYSNSAKHPGNSVSQKRKRS